MESRPSCCLVERSGDAFVWRGRGKQLIGAEGVALLSGKFGDPRGMPGLAGVLGTWQGVSRKPLVNSPKAHLAYSRNRRNTPGGFDALFESDHWNPNRNMNCKYIL